MRIAFLGDVHGNLAALEAVLADLATVKADQTVCLGDLVFKGPQGQECVDRIEALGIPTITGNTDRYILQNPPDVQAALRQGGTAAEQAERAIALLDWHRDRLDARAVDFLRRGTEKFMATAGGVSLLAVHGSPKSDEDAIFPHTPEDRLAEVLGAVQARLLVCGHSHHAFLRPSRGKMVVGAGSVGRPFDGDPRAAWALVEMDGLNARISLRRVAYEVERTAAAAAEAGLPGLDSYLAGLRAGENL